MSIFRPPVLTFPLVLFLVAVSFTISCSHHASHAFLPLGNLDSPSGGATLRGNATVAGWALAEEGLDEVAIYLDRRYVESVSPGLARPDVQKAYPQFNDAGHSGWSALLPLTGVAPGSHAIAIAIRSKTGGVISYSVQVVVQ